MSRSDGKTKRLAKPSAAIVRAKRNAQAPKSKRNKLIVQVSLLGITLAAVGLAVVASVNTSSRSSARMSASPLAIPLIQPVANKPLELPQYDIEPKTLDELLALPVEALGQIDMARMHLLCATQLPSTQNLDVEHALATLDQWAEKVAAETEKYLYRLTDPRHADHYGHSEAQYRAEMLAQVLQEDLGVRYNTDAAGHFSFADITTGFIHGMIPAPGSSIEETPGGTCASMPVLYVAVGRKLGYPLKLMTTDSHVFARWDGLASGGHENPAWRERFNCETTNGFHRFDDDYYRTWPYPVTEHEIAVNGFLKSFSPAEELAFFLATRGHHGEDVGESLFAARCYENAYRYDTSRPCYRSWFRDAAAKSGYQPSTPALQQRQMLPRFASSSRPQPVAFAGGMLPSQTRIDLPTQVHNPSRQIGHNAFPAMAPAQIQPGFVRPSPQQPPSPTAYYETPPASR